VGPFESGILRVAAASGFQAVSSEIELGKLIETLLQSSRVALRVERASALPIVLADKVQLQQVILNLVLNGIEAMQPVADRPRELVIRLEHTSGCEQPVLTTLGSRSGGSLNTLDVWGRRIATN
jgi:C4-dicarboxylate-specific signal transduction histidine kinase